MNLKATLQREITRLRGQNAKLRVLGKHTKLVSNETVNLAAINDMRIEAAMKALGRG